MVKKKITQKRADRMARLKSGEDDRERVRATLD